ncbi:MAG: hypothetical protein U0840_11035 [Gemmataceae bacterium]
MTTANGTSNHRVARKTLADEIDRLSGLAATLNESIADAVQDVIGRAVGEAVEAAITKVLSSPALLQAALEKHTPSQPAPVPPTPEPRKPSLKEKLANTCSCLRAKVARVVHLARKKLSEVRTSVSQVASQATQVLAAVPSIARAVTRLVWTFRKPGVVAVGVGLACGVACYLSGPLFASVANGVGGAAVTLSALILPLRRCLAARNV